MNEPRPIGDVLDGLGIEATLDESKGELAAGAVVLLKVIDTDGNVRLSMAYSDGLSWIERAGMVHVAEVMETRANGLTRNEITLSDEFHDHPGEGTLIMIFWGTAGEVPPWSVGFRASGDHALPPRKVTAPTPRNAAKWSDRHGEGWSTLPVGSCARP